MNQRSKQKDENQDIVTSKGIDIFKEKKKV